MNKRVTVRLSADLLNRAKRKAAAEGRTLASLIEEVLRLVLAEGKNAATVKHAPPPVSRATGGPMPGIDLNDLSALQEMDDLEYVERMKYFRKR